MFTIFHHYLQYVPKKKLINIKEVLIKFIVKIINNVNLKLDSNKKSRDLKLGVIKAYNISTLPLSIERYYTLPVSRVFRFVGGICVGLVITKYYLHFPYVIQLFILVLSLIQMFLIVLISIVRVIYSIYKLIFHSKEFEVQNSPLNPSASIIARLMYCWKVGCTITGGGIGAIVAGSVIDEVLEEAGHGKVFIPYLASHLKTFTNLGVQSPLRTHTLFS